MRIRIQFRPYYIDTRHLIRFSNTKALQQIPGVLPKTNKQTNLLQNIHEEKKNTNLLHQTPGRDKQRKRSYNTVQNLQERERRALEEQQRKKKKKWKLLIISNTQNRHLLSPHHHPQNLHTHSQRPQCSRLLTKSKTATSARETKMWRSPGRRQQ